MDEHLWTLEQDRRTVGRLYFVNLNLFVYIKEVSLDVP
jgi:hypothetical protein